MNNLKLVAFDLDGTLAPSKSPLPKEMSNLLNKLINNIQVCIISGGDLPQFQKQVLEMLPTNTNLENLHLMPTCGTKYLRFKNNIWIPEYINNLPLETRWNVIDALEDESRHLGLWEENPYGEIIEDRGSQITYSALGQQAPEDKKHLWDPSGEKRKSLVIKMSAIFPDLEIRSGGSTSVDITKKGIDKAYGIRKLSESSGISIQDMVFFGDRLDEGGNDYPVFSTGIKAISVSGWQDTANQIKSILASING